MTKWKVSGSGTRKLDDLYVVGKTRDLVDTDVTECGQSILLTNIAQAVEDRT